MKTHGFARILLATDGSEQATAAIGVTRSFAHASDAHVRVVHVWNTETHHHNGAWDVEVRSEADRLIEETVNQLRSTGVEADGEIIRANEGHLATAVAAAAEQFHADLVVAGSRGLSEWQSMVKHSTSHQLLRSLDCPLLIVRTDCSAAAHDAQRVLLAVAGAHEVPTAVKAAIAAAAAPGSEVMVAHVEQSLVGLQGFAYAEPEDEIQETLNQAAALLKQAGVVAHTLVATAGPVAQTVAQLAEGWNADVIVLASSRMGDIEGMLLGSVTHQLLRATDRPVLIAERVKS